MNSDEVLPPELERLMWEELAASAEVSRQWGSLEDNLVARYLSDPSSCSEEELREVEEAMVRYPALRSAIVDGRRFLSGVDEAPSPRPGWIDGLRAVSLAGVALMMQIGLSEAFRRRLLAHVDVWRYRQTSLVWAAPLLFGLMALLVWINRARGAWRHGRLVVVMAGLIFGLGLAGLFGFAEWRLTTYANQADALFTSVRYVTYEPPGLVPGDPATLPSAEAIRLQLVPLVTEAGFDGLITFSVDGTLADVPRIAREVGFRRVILGIYISRGEGGRVIDPGPQIEDIVRRGLARDVDGFCLGHNTSMQMDLVDLARSMTKLREATGKPVTTTAPIVMYLGERGRALREMGDWYFPDTTPGWQFGPTTPAEGLRDLQRSLVVVADLPRDKPVLLKMVSFPSGPPGSGFTPAAQAEFFTLVGRNLYLPAGVHVSVFNAYDLPWKGRDPGHFGRQEEFIGLFDKDLRPKEAVAVVRRGFPVQGRR
jgi:hypothetical protein